MGTYPVGNQINHQMFLLLLFYKCSCSNYEVSCVHYKKTCFFFATTSEINLDYVNKTEDSKMLLLYIELSIKITYCFYFRVLTLINDK